VEFEWEAAHSSFSSYKAGITRQMPHTRQNAALAPTTRQLRVGGLEVGGWLVGMNRWGVRREWCIRLERDCL
jgi:hypothetical protein